MQRSSARHRGWYVGWSLGIAVVGVAAGLLLAIIQVAWRIGTQAQDIERSLRASQRNTTAITAVPGVNAKLASLADTLTASVEVEEVS